MLIRKEIIIETENKSEKKIFVIVIDSRDGRREKKKAKKMKNGERRNRRKWRNLKMIKTAGNSLLYRRISGRSGRRRAPYRKKGLAFPKRRPLKTDNVSYSVFRRR
jgi:hypothetical protein